MSNETVFSDVWTRSPGVSRRIVGHGRAVAIELWRAGERIKRHMLFTEHTAAVLEALDLARRPEAWANQRAVADLQDGPNARLRIWLRHFENGVVLFFGRFNPDGTERGKPIVLDADEWDSLEAAVLWLGGGGAVDAR